MEQECRAWDATGCIPGENLRCASVPHRGGSGVAAGAGDGAPQLVVALCHPPALVLDHRGERVGRPGALSTALSTDVSRLFARVPADDGRCVHHHIAHATPGPPSEVRPVNAWPARSPAARPFNALFMARGR